MAITYLRRNLRYIWPWNWRAALRAIFRRVTGSGILSAPNELSMASLHPVQKAAKIIDLVRPRSVLDVGCGTGQTTAYIAAQGIEVLGIEASRQAIVSSPRPELIRRHDLRSPLDLSRQFDLVWCFEVAEHIHPKYVDVFLDSLVRHSAVIAMSAAPPGQGGEGHFNEQPQSYWCKKFSDRQYSLCSEWTTAMKEVPEFYSNNMMVFVRHK